MSSRRSNRSPPVAMSFRWSRLRSDLLAWYDDHARGLPWRNQTDPYRIWVSEVMLQQTQVATVIPYYDRFLHRFPNVQTLAKATEKTVLRYWEGLGYYRRAKQLHVAAKQIASEHGGAFPRTMEEIMSLPGIGRYTAGAILSFAWNERAPIVEANTKRLYARLLGIREPLSKQGNEKLLWEFAERLIDDAQPGKLNQALMELGSQVCRVRDPECTTCPLQRYCRAYGENIVDQVPASEGKKKYTELIEAAVVIRDNHGRWLFRHCQKGERWAGLWDFPRWELGRIKGTNSWLAEQVAKTFDLPACIEGPVDRLRHGVTRYRISLQVYLGYLESPGNRWNDSKFARWIASKQLGNLPLNATAREIANRWCLSQSERG